jgi:hypothetical protein
MNIENSAEMAKKADEMAHHRSDLVQIQTPSGACAIFGAHLVHAKFIGIIGAILNLPEWSDGGTMRFKNSKEQSTQGPGIHSIVFRGDGMPCKAPKNDVFGASYPNTLSCAINLRKNFKTALNTVITEEPTLSLRTSLWHEMMTSTFHEIHHVTVMAMLDPDDVWTDEDYDAEEESAKEWAAEKIAELAASDLDIEPPPFSEEPFFGFLFMQENVERMQGDSDTAVWDNQIKMLTENWAYHDPTDGTTCHTFKDWINVNLTEVTNEKVSDAVTDNKTNVMETKIINKDTGVESNVQTTDANAVIPVSDITTHVESTFVQDGDGTVIEVKGNHTSEEAVAIAFGTASDWKPGTKGEVVKEEVAVELFAPSYEPTLEPDAELMDLIENGVDDEPFVPGPGSASAEAAYHAAAADQPVFTSPQTVIEEQPVHETAKVNPEMTQAFDPQAIRQTTQLLFQRLFTHIFTKCRPVQGIFTNPTAIFEPVPVTDIPGINILVGCDTINETGQFKKNNPVQGFVKGQIFQKSKLPAYHIYLNIGGVTHQRRLVPQNITTGSSAAQEAAAGNNIGWIIDAAETDKNAAFKFKYTNGVITPC